jgi:Tfp pilus assembly protein PilF
MRFQSKALLLLPLLFCGLASAQPRTSTSERTGVIRGNVVLPDGSMLTEAARVSLKVFRGEQAFSLTDSQGRFELVNIVPGQYTVEVEDRNRRYEISSETVQVPRGGGTVLLTIYLKEKRTTTTNPTDKTVSVAMLDQKVPPAAHKQFQNATKLFQEGKTVEGIESLRRAIAIYPDYLMAHNDLGAQLLEQERYEEAIVELDTAIKIDPNAFHPRLNKGLALLRQNKFSEALVSLDKALSIEPSSPAAHLYAGMAAVKLSDATRGEKEFKASYDLGGMTYAIALFHLGQLYMKRGDRQNALQSFETFLHDSPNEPNAAQAEKFISMLRKQ